MRVPSNLAGLALVGIGFAGLYWNVLATLVTDWATDDNYSHGFLIPPLAIYFAWQRRDRFRAAAARPSGLGLAIVLVSMLVLATGVLGSELFLTRISIIGTIAGTIVFLYGWRRLHVALFPVAFLILMIPLPAIIFNQIAFPLQLFASRVGEFLLSSADIPVLREGNVLVLATTSLEVAEACSGIRSLVSLLTFAIVFGCLSDSRVWVTTVIALATIPNAIAANAIRVAGTGMAAHRYGPAVAEGFFHTFSGWLLFVVAFLLMLGLQRLLVRIAPASPKAPT